MAHAVGLRSIAVAVRGLAAAWDALTDLTELVVWYITRIIFLLVLVLLILINSDTVELTFLYLYFVIDIDLFHCCCCCLL